MGTVKLTALGAARSLAESLPPSRPPISTPPYVPTPPSNPYDSLSPLPHVSPRDADISPSRRPSTRYPLLPTPVTPASSFIAPHRRHPTHTHPSPTIQPSPSSGAPTRTRDSRANFPANKPRHPLPSPLVTNSSKRKRHLQPSPASELSGSGGSSSLRHQPSRLSRAAVSAVNMSPLLSPASSTSRSTSSSPPRSLASSVSPSYKVAPCPETPLATAPPTPSPNMTARAPSTILSSRSNLVIPMLIGILFGVAMLWSPTLSPLSFTQKSVARIEHSLRDVNNGRFAPPDIRLPPESSQNPPNLENPSDSNSFATPPTLEDVTFFF